MKPLTILPLLLTIPTITSGFTIRTSTSATSRAGLFVAADHHIESPTSAASGAAPFSVGGPSQELLDLFNEQITKEFAASHMYLSASIWFDGRDWEGMSKYMMAESAEERVHALSFIDFANKRNIPIQLQGLPEPPGADCWDTPLDVWCDLLKLEETNTKSLLKIAEAANKCQDFAVLSFLAPHHLEQVDAESKISSIISKVRDENQTPGLLRQLDQELGAEAGA